ncbi:RabGAP/TBC domain-containing protein [Reticulomyxa filosa]|uniref:RabGAP/TBC domain-containing protein n=1 Tax=Reticulomyxa filosa TaxID=46433 RepID=X6MQ07_RETFI|nr:RabGAP/TBC domain-containing protein [Reticulomyxa filosa]|eukprot:ETO15185.1 RabGAP/TBC domain-containing protein [Reticulomyxa filosa]
MMKEEKLDYGVDRPQDWNSSNHLPHNSGSVSTSVQASTLPKTPDSDDDTQANYIAGTEASKTLPSPHDDADLNASTNNIKTEASSSSSAVWNYSTTSRLQTLKTQSSDDEHGNDGVKFTIVPPPPTIPPPISFPKTQAHKPPISDDETNPPLSTSFNRASSTTSIKVMLSVIFFFTWTNDKTPPSDEETEVKNSSMKQKSTPDYVNGFNYNGSNNNNNNNAKSAEKDYCDAHQRRNSSGGPSTAPETTPFSERCSKYGAEQSPFVNSKDATAKTSHNRDSIGSSENNKKKASNEKKHDREKSQNDRTKIITKEKILSDFKQYSGQLVDIVKRERSYSNSQPIKILLFETDNFVRQKLEEKRDDAITKFISDCPLGISISFPGKVDNRSDLKILAQHIHAPLLGIAKIGLLFCNSGQERCAIFLSKKTFFKAAEQCVIPSIAWDNQNETNGHFKRSKKFFLDNCFKEENAIKGYIEQKIPTGFVEMLLLGLRKNLVSF